MMLSYVVKCVAEAAAPFINIYFAAQILNELAGACRSERLTSLVLLTAALNLVGMMAAAGTKRWAAYCESQSWMLRNYFFTEKMLGMDFIDQEDAKTQEALAEIKANQNGMGFGLGKLLMVFEDMCAGFIRIIISTGFAFSLFTTVVPEGSPYTFLDSPLCVLAVLAMLIFSVLLAPYITVRGWRLWAGASDDNNRGNRLYSFYCDEMINGSGRAKDLRIYNQQRLIEDGINRFWNFNAWIKLMARIGRYEAASTAVSYLINGLIYLFIAMKAYAGAFGVGSIVMYAGAVMQFGGGFGALFGNLGEIVNNSPYLKKVFDFLDIPNKKYQGTIPVEKRDDNEYEIEFKNVSFKYTGSEVWALRNLSMKLHIGRRMAVVGMNGSGKTTMIKLLCRLYDPTEGAITLNGIDIKKYDYDEYMGIFSVVFQDFKLLPFSLGQNVAAGVDFDAARVTSALTIAGFGERLSSMPKGLDTLLYKNFTDEGVEVSGGEAQKIALARAIYKQAPFIVLDEPTAALDPVAEYEVYSRFNEIVGGQTAVYISHRLSSCRFCDDICVFHEGRLVQRGSHDVLLADDHGKYFELWNAQAQYYNM
jgi:ATP-binding cassette subfamily B protein